MPEPVLRTVSLDAGYRQKIVIGGVSLTLEAGKIMTLIGPNGAGKSTILRTIAQELAPISGAAFLDGEDLQRIPRNRRAKSMASLFTESIRPELMTCREVVQAGRYPYTGHLGIPSEGDLRIVEETLTLVGAEGLADSYFDICSDGQKQLVRLAGVLAQKPRILVLDEPVSYLDIRYKLEVLTILKKLVREEGLAVIMSLHELDLAKRVSDLAVCIGDGKIQRIGTPEECFDKAFLSGLFRMRRDAYDPCFDSLEYGPAETESPVFPHYINAGGKRLRLGYTTGSCAALAAAGAARRLLLGTFPESVRLVTPAGIPVEVSLEGTEAGEDYALCGVRKDGGDDIDVTDGALIFARVEPNESGKILIEGGEGIGRVTRPGLDRPVGDAAINTVPRRMIEEAVGQAALLAGYEGGLTVTVFVPEGEKLAEKTFNPQLGIEGGISILGTSGIVEPMSTQALVDTIHLSLRQAAAEGNSRVILTPGNLGMEFLMEHGLASHDAGSRQIPVVKCSNFIGEALDEAASLGFKEVLLAGHIGKLVKLAGGIMNTHSRWADCRTELFTAHAALAGADTALCRNLKDAATSEACLEILREAGLDGPVMESLLADIRKHLRRRAPSLITGALLFSSRTGAAGMTKEAEELLQKWKGSTE